MRTSIARAYCIRPLLAATLALAIAFTLGCEEKKSAAQIEAEKAKLAQLDAIEAKAAAEAASAQAAAAAEVAAKAAVKYAGIYECECRNVSDEKLNIVLTEKDGKITGFYYGTYDEFYEGREGVGPSFFVLPMIGLEINGDIIEFVLEVNNSDLLTKPVDVKITSTREAIRAGYENWKEGSISTEAKQYTGHIQADGTILFKGSSKDYDKEFIRRKLTAAFTAPAAIETFTDSRDNKTYRTVKMPDDKTWMAENLNYQPSTGNSWCYDWDAGNSYCDKYGRLYDWDAAMKACPAGWHLPSAQEWNDLVKTAGGKTVAGKKLKSKSGWENRGNGTDDYGFSALPGGSRVSESSYYTAGGGGYWWTATESVSKAVSFGVAYRRSMNYDRNGVGEGSEDDKKYGFSVRCVKD